MTKLRDTGIKCDQGFTVSFEFAYVDTYARIKTFDARHMRIKGTFEQVKATVDSTFTIPLISVKGALTLT